MSADRVATAPLVELAGELAEEFASRAAEHDRENTFPHENVRRMQETGYTSLVVPESHGGSGADIEQFCICQEKLAEGCGATALAINMHLFACGSMVEMRDLEAPDKVHFLDAVGEGRRIVGGGLTEPESGGNWGAFVTRAAHRDGAYVVNGRKAFNSLSPAIDLYFLMVTMRGADKKVGSGTLLVPRGTPGLTVRETWDAMGMRATASHDLIIENCKVPESCAIRVRPVGEVLPVDVSLYAWFSLGIASVYTGVAAAALSFAKEFAGRHQPVPLSRPIAHMPGVQFSIADAETQLEAMRALTLDTARRYAAGEPFEGEEGLKRVVLPKYFATNHAVRIVEAAIEVCGAVGFLKKFPLERFYRDVRAGTIHPFSNARARELIGKASLGIPLLDLPRWG